MLRRPALAMALALVAAQALAAPADSGYRLAGVIDRGGDGSVAILALPDGGQVLIHRGSVVDGGIVTVLSRRAVRIAFPDRVLELTLSQQPGETTPPGGSRGGSTSPAALPGSGARHSRAAPQRRAPQAIPTPITRTVSSAVVRSFIVNGVAEAPSSTNAKQYVDDEIAQAFELPAHSRVVSVNDQAVDSADQTVSRLQQALTGGVAVVTVDTPHGQQRVYVAPPPANR